MFLESKELAENSGSQNLLGLSTWGSGLEMPQTGTTGESPGLAPSGILVLNQA